MTTEDIASDLEAGGLATAVHNALVSAAEQGMAYQAGRSWPADPEEHELTSVEGVQYAPRIILERNDLGQVCRLEVGLTVTLPEVDAEGNHVTHTTMLVPSIATGEGPGNGNVFWYEDDDALSHIAWHPGQEFGTITPEETP